MNRKQLIVKLACLLSSLLEADGMPMPASMIYLAMGSNRDDYKIVSEVGALAGWLEVTSETVALTEAGTVKAKEFQALGV